MKKIESPLMGKFKSTLPGWVGLRKIGIERKCILLFFDPFNLEYVNDNPFSHV